MPPRKYECEDIPNENCVKDKDGNGKWIKYDLEIILCKRVYGTSTVRTCDLFLKYLKEFFLQELYRFFYFHYFNNL